MLIENALKSYAIEAVLQDAKSENLDDIFEKSITDYRFLKKGSMAYHNSYSKRMALKVKINNVLINSYNHSFNDIVNYFLIQTKIFQFGQYYNLLLLGSLEIFMFVLMLKSIFLMKYYISQLNLMKMENFHFSIEKNLMIWEIEYTNCGGRLRTTLGGV